MKLLNFNFFDEEKMENFENMPRPEIVLVADTVAREKNIDREDVFVAMEVAIQKAGRTKYGFEHDIRATIDRKTGAISLARYREVVADGTEIENEAAQLYLDDAKDWSKTQIFVTKTDNISHIKIESNNNAK